MGGPFSEEKTLPLMSTLWFSSFSVVLLRVFCFIISMVERERERERKRGEKKKEAKKRRKKDEKQREAKQQQWEEKPWFKRVYSNSRGVSGPISKLQHIRGRR